MKNLKSFINIWKNGLNFTGKTSKEEFLEYFLIHYSIVIFINLFKSLVLFIQSDIVGYKNEAFYEVLDLFFNLLNFLFVLYKLGSIVIQIPLSFRSLRNAKAKWQWVFLNIINPVGCILIYLFPLTNSKKN